MRDSVYVGIGTSAGGLEALTKLLKYLPKKTGYVYIIAQHTNPDKPSALVQLLTEHSKLPVSEATIKCDFKPDQIYIIPPSHNLIYDKDHLTLKKIKSAAHHPTPCIDEMFKALSLYKHENAVAVVLTGMGNDGSQGIVSIKKYHGIAIAQLPFTAKHPSMPQSAIDTNMVDYQLDLNDIATHLVSIMSIQSNLISKPSPVALREIAKMLHNKEHLDIFKYKSEMIHRRIAKRTMLLNLKDINEYFTYIRNNPQEVHFLYKEILIHVTSFFRDKKAFEALKQQLKKYLSNKPDGYNLRIWSIGCSSGEEAYTIAIIVDTIKKELHKDIKLHIFATDIDDKALNNARAALYTQDETKEIQDSLLDEYFVKKQNNYTVKSFIKEQIIFTHHNILNDPPFINQDLISLRNLLIYFEPSTQKEVFSLCYNSLKSEGLLFLGLWEAMLVEVKYFQHLDKDTKIYKKQILQNPPRLSMHYFNKQRQLNKNIALVQTNKDKLIDIKKMISKEIFNFFEPNFIMIDQDYSIIYKKGDLPFISMPDGFISLNILDNIHKDLRYDAQKVLEQATRTKSTQETSFVEIKLNNGKTVLVRIVTFIFYLKNNTLNFMLYFQQLDFNDIEFYIENSLAKDKTLIKTNLLSQLKRAKEEYQALQEQSILYKENMQLLNEELQSSNEELQSQAEELETSNEELKSSNAQLQNLNDKLTSLLAQNSQLKDQLSLILNSTRDAIIGLDINGNHTFVNDTAVKLLGYAKEELIGKSGHKLWHHTKPDGTVYPLNECVQYHALQKGDTYIDADLYWRKDGTSFEVSVIQTPIIQKNKILGAVLAFHDVTEQNRIKRMAEHEYKLARFVMELDKTIVMTLDNDANITMISKNGANLLGSRPAELIGINIIQTFIPKNNRHTIRKFFKELISENSIESSHHTTAIIDKNNQEHIMSWIAKIIANENQQAIGLTISAMDITAQEKLARQLQKQEHIYKVTFDRADIGIAHIGLNGYLIDSNPYLSIILGYSKQELKQLSTSDVTVSEDIDKEIRLIEHLLNDEQEEYRLQKRFITKLGHIIWAEVTGVLIRDNNGKPLYVLKTTRDITEVKLLMLQLQNERTMLQDIINFMPIPVMIYDEDGKILIINQEFENVTEYNVKNFATLQNLSSAICPTKERKKRSLAFYLSAFKNDGLQSAESIVTTKLGDKKIIISSIIGLHIENEHNKRLAIFTALDITNMRNNEEIMVSQSRQAAMGDMLSMIAHQWRQPLGVIAMSANNIHATLDLQEEIKPQVLHSFIKTIDEQTQYLSKTVDDFRDFFKPDKQRETVTFDNIFERLSSLTDKALQNNNIQLLLPKANGTQIQTYQNQLIQVMLNIINNAKDAIKEHNPAHKVIKVNIKDNIDKIIISICDSGGGIDKTVLNSLAQPYITTKGKNGTGLGLYMSRVIITKHLGGTLRWKNEKNGACFYIELDKDKHSCNT